MNWLLLLVAIATIESGNNDKAVGRLGEISRYQIRPTTWAAYSKSKEYSNPVVAKEVALSFLKRIYAMLPAKSRTMRDVLVCYNWGIGNYRKVKFNYTKVPKQVKTYVNKVTKLYATKKQL